MFVSGMNNQNIFNIPQRGLIWDFAFKWIMKQKLKTAFNQHVITFCFPNMMDNTTNGQWFSERGCYPISNRFNKSSKGRTFVCFFILVSSNTLRQNRTDSVEIA